MTPAPMPPGLDARTTAERAFNALGFDAHLVDAVVGDLAEQLEERVREHGAVAARLWYARQLLRSAPHLFIGALRRGSLRARILLGTSAGVVLVALAATVAFVIMRDGPPAQLVSELSDDAGNVLINNTRAIRLPMRVLDKRGHVLDEQAVRYQWIAGTPMGVSSDGIFQCTERGDAVVRATLGDMVKNLAVRCRPVVGIRAASWLDLVAGDKPKELPFVGVGVDGEPVSLLRGTVRVRDSTVATLNGMLMRPVTVGQTWVSVTVGDKSADIRVLVNEPVTSFEHLRRDQHYVARQVHLAQGDTVQWALPRGNFWLKYIPSRPDDAPPTITLDGRVFCQLGNPIRAPVVTTDVYGTMCAVDGPASVKIAHGRMGAAFVDGYLLLDIK